MGREAEAGAAAAGGGEATRRRKRPQCWGRRRRRPLLGFPAAGTDERTSLHRGRREPGTLGASISANPSSGTPGVKWRWSAAAAAAAAACRGAAAALPTAAPSPAAASSRIYCLRSGDASGGCPPRHRRPAGRGALRQAPRQAGHRLRGDAARGGAGGDAGAAGGGPGACAAPCLRIRTRAIASFAAAARGGR